MFNNLAFRNFLFVAYHQPEMVFHPTVLPAGALIFSSIEVFPQYIFQLDPVSVSRLLPSLFGFAFDCGIGMLTFCILVRIT